MFPIKHLPTNLSNGRSVIEEIGKVKRHSESARIFFVLAILMTSLRALAEPLVLVYTRNHVSAGEGYVHDNIAASVEALRSMGTKYGFTVEVSDSPSVFTSRNLTHYTTLIFDNSNNEAFDNDSQRQAFREFIHRGGGFVGIHSAAGSERHWPYFWSVLGGTFAGHPAIQTFKITRTKQNISGLTGIPKVFLWTDECYFFTHLNPDINPLLTTQRSELLGTETLNVDLETMPHTLPLAWIHRFDHGREFYIALGHSKEDYANPLFLQILTAGILWANDAHIP